jgi:4'-phosphopantetheinyl transferase EntD
MSATPARIQRAFHVEKLFPAGVVAFETREGASPDDLLPSEREYIARAVDTRVAEFAAGRLCARAGMEALGLAPAPIPSGKDRAPTWPAGIVGSITHTDDYCVAVVGEAKAFASLGVDAEAAGRLKPDLWHLTLHTEERKSLQGVEEAAARAAATVFFSAKEAFYKCQYALTRSWIGFEDVIVRLREGTFELTVVEESRPAFQIQKSWQGRYTADEALVIAGMALPSGDR